MEKLKHAINFVTSEETKKLKKNYNFQFNSPIIANLKKIKQIQNDFTIKGIKSPSNAAALAIAQSSICHLKSERGPQQERSGIQMAKKKLKIKPSILLTTKLSLNSKLVIVLAIHHTLKK